MILRPLAHLNNYLFKKRQNQIFFCFARFNFFLLQYFLPPLPPLGLNIFTYSDDLGKLGYNYNLCVPFHIIEIY